MKTLNTILGLSLALVTGALAQTKPTDPGTTTTPPVIDTGRANATTRVSDAMKNLPAGVADKIAAARDAAKAAKDAVDAMKASGKTPEEILAMITEKKATALLNLQKALDALNSLPDAAKERVTKAKDIVTKRLDERKSDVTTTP